MNNKISIALVDDHLLLLQALADMINKFKNYHVDFLCNNGDLLIKEIIKSNRQPNIVLMDVNMPIMNGIETTQWLTNNYPEIKVLVLSVEGEEKTILDMMRAGARGYLLKDVDKVTLYEALISLSESGFYHSTLVDNVIHNTFIGKVAAEVNLKEQEINFLRLLCTEITYKEIAHKMHLSPKTIDSYRDSLFVKLNVKNRVGLVIYSIKNGIYKI